MSNLLDRGARMLDRLRKQSMSGVVTYRRGSAEVSVSAARGVSRFDTIDDSGGVLAVTSEDFLVSASDLVLDGNVTTPMRGDVIEAEEGGRTRQYAVLPPTGSTPCWRWADGFRYTIRIHARLSPGAGA
ncbi:MAG: hypothetical protein IPM64_17265 [Phycisphaerales bacterium]|nr:hypothetical protein [Phycisphaerales bacterium]